MGDNNISIAFNAKLMLTLILSIFLYAYESWTMAAELERRTQAVEMRCYRKILNITYKDHVANEEVCNKIERAMAKHNDLSVVKAQTQKVRLYLKILWHGQDKSARDSKMSKKKWKTEKEVGRQHKGLDRTSIWRIYQSI